MTSTLRCDDPYDDFEEDETCPTCGGEGVLDDECECQSVEDVCCCLNPVPPTCPYCCGAG